MLQVVLTIAAVYAISWIVSTPEGRAEAKPWADKWGKIFLGAVLGLVAWMWLISWTARPVSDTPAADAESGEK